MSRRTYVVTGGTGGIGREIVRDILSSGDRVIFTGRSEERGNGIVDEFGSENAVFHRTDHSIISDTVKFAGWLSGVKYRIDGLVNNASRNSRFSVLDITLEEWQSLLNLSLTSNMLISKRVAENMIRTGGSGKIVNIGAIQFSSPLPSSLAYAAVKGALISMSRSMAVDLGKYGIQVTTLIPGPIYSKGDEPPASVDNSAATLLERFGRMGEVVKLVKFLLSDDNTFMTGNEIIIDGGRIISRRPDPDEVSSGRL